MGIVDAIKKEAQNQNISLAEIARRLGLSSPQSLNQMMKDESIRFSIVQRIAEILDISIDKLLHGKDTVNINIDTTESRLLSIIESQQRTIENLTNK